MPKNIRVFAISILLLFVPFSFAETIPITPSLEQQIKQAIKGSKFEIERRGEAVVVVIPIRGNFNAKREGILLPSSLKPLTNLAKIVKQDNSLALLVIGHSDDEGDSLYASQVISLKRANSIGSIFRVAGLDNNQLYLSGVGDTQHKQTKLKAKDKDINKRVELILVKEITKDDFATLANHYAVINYNK